MADIFKLSLFSLSLLAPAAVMLTFVVLAFRKKGYSFPDALVSQELRLYLSCLLLINCISTWCFSHCGYEVINAQEKETAYLIRALVLLVINLAIVLICSLPLFCRLQLLLFRRQISLIQQHGIEQSLFVILNALLFMALTVLTVPLSQLVFVQYVFIKGNMVPLIGLFHVDIAFCTMIAAFAGIAIALARGGEEVRTLRTIKDEGLLPEYMAGRSDKELYPLMTAAQGLLKLNRVETLKAIESLAPTTDNEQIAKIIEPNPENEN